jgi:hypothetical protein
MFALMQVHLDEHAPADENVNELTDPTSSVRPQDSAYTTEPSENFPHESTVNWTSLAAVGPPGCIMWNGSAVVAPGSPTVSIIASGGVYGEDCKIFKPN